MPRFNLTASKNERLFSDVKDAPLGSVFFMLSFTFVLLPSKSRQSLPVECFHYWKRETRLMDELQPLY